MKQAREVALDALTACERQGAWSDGYLKKAIGGAKLDGRDAALATRLCFGVLQNRMLLDFYLSKLCATPLHKLEASIRNLLRLGAYQLLYLNRVPDHAAVSEAVSLARKKAKNPRAAGLVNGVLRSLIRQREALEPPADLSTRYSHPQWLVDSFVARLGREEAEALLAGMVLDTKQFTMRTGSRTFEAAAFLRRSGADTGDVKKLFQNDLEGTIAKYDIIQNAKMYHEGIAVAKVDHTVGRITAAQAADELLNISGIDTSFVLFPDQEGRVILSARSMGDVNVQVVLEKLGGGGNAATAGAQVPGKGVDEVNDMLLQAIDAYLEEE